MFDKSTVTEALMNIEGTQLQLDLEKLVSKAGLQALPGLVEIAKSDLRDRKSFFTAPRYRQATNTIDIATRVLNASLHPLKIADEFNGLDYVGPGSPGIGQFREMLYLFETQRFNPVKRILDSIILDLITKLEPDIVGISQVYDSQSFLARYTSHFIKSVAPQTTIVLGGTSITEQVDRVIVDLRSIWDSHFGQADYLLLGEAELALMEFVRKLSLGEDVLQVPNLVYRDLHTSRVNKNARKRAQDLDSLPPPIYDKEMLGLYWSPSPVVLLAPTRGCYWDRCAFCAYGLREGDRATAPYREMSPERLSEHVRSVIDQTGSKHIIFAVDLIRPEQAEAYAVEFKRTGLNFCWQAETRPDGSLLKQGRLETLYQGGLRHLSFGMESCSQEVLDSMDKGTKVKNFVPLFESLNDVGIAIDLMLFRDFPTETEANLHETIEFLTKHKRLVHRPIRLGRFHLIDGCKVQKTPEAYGVKIDQSTMASAVMRPDVYVWDWASSDLRNSASSSSRPAGDSPRIRAGLQTLCGDTHVGRRPWVGATGGAHTFLYFSCAGIESIRLYNAFINRVRNFLLKQLFHVKNVEHGLPLEVTAYPGESEAIHETSKK
jgi:hypothetical protein